MSVRLAVHHLVTAVLRPSQPAQWLSTALGFFGDAGEARVSMATRLLHHYSPAAVVKLVFGQALRQPNSDSTHSSLHTHTHTLLRMPKSLKLNSSNKKCVTICSNIARFWCELLSFRILVVTMCSRVCVFKGQCATCLKRPVWVCLSHRPAGRFL